MLILRVRDGVHTQRATGSIGVVLQKTIKLLVSKEELMQTGKQKEDKIKTIHYSKICINQYRQWQVKKLQCKKKIQLQTL